MIEELSEALIRAKVREYTIELNPKEKVLRHDCDDWRKGLGTRRICKHIARLFMTVSLKQGKEILRDIIENKDSWRFQLI